MTLQELGKPSCCSGFPIRVQGLVVIALKSNGQLRPLYTPYASHKNLLCLSAPFLFPYIPRCLPPGYSTSSFVYSQSFQRCFYGSLFFDNSAAERPSLFQIYQCLRLHYWLIVTSLEADAQKHKFNFFVRS